VPHIQIEKLAYGGSGFGRLDGKAFFVPFTAPGDLAAIRVEKNKKSYSEGVVTELLQSSGHRSSPPCPFFGDCGGCNWQHISYKEQCSQKEAILADILWRNARIQREKIQPILSAASPFGYRQRIQLKVDYSAGRRSLGFHRRCSHDVVDINDHCAIAAEPLNAAISKIRAILGSFKDPHFISQVDLAASSDALVSAVFHYRGTSPETLAAHLIHANAGVSGLHSFSIRTGSKRMPQHVSGLEKLRYSVPSADKTDMDLYFAPDSFSQVNFSQNRVMVQLLLDNCVKTSPDSILDLYSGNGNFSLPLAGSVKNILGLESAMKSVSLAQYNTHVNGINNARYECQDSAAGVEVLAKKPGQFDLVIMDPPRTGADEVSRQIHRVGATQLIYISCDPPTLGRDLATLQKNGFEVASVQPVDMFPQTYHLENVVFLKPL